MWRAPVILPTDLEVWEALPWLKEAGPIPNKAIILTASGGGDYDGDDVFVTDNASLVAFLEETIAAVAAYICTSIPKGLRLEPPKDHQKQPWQT